MYPSTLPSLAQCPVETTLNIIGDKWKPLIIYHLLDGTKRYSELQRRIPNVTRRMLTEHLRELEVDGIVHREVYKQVPPKVEYSLTAMGITLKPVLDTILNWGIWYQQQTSEVQRNEGTKG
jgi:DNA-binding HxlR family transcriptional regulator